MNYDTWKSIIVFKRDPPECENCGEPREHEDWSLCDECQEKEYKLINELF